VKTKNIAKREKNEAVSFLNSIHNYSSALIYYLEAMSKDDISDVFFTVSAGQRNASYKSCNFIDIFGGQTRKDILTKSHVLSAP
jgi:hypothetical protein